MDQASKSPEPRDRAVSAEPCSTRPNPFDDGDSSRKRRRTSLSGSRSLSVDTVQSHSEVPTGSSTHTDPLAQPNATMTMDTDPSTPQTPEPAQSTDPDCPAEPASSRVTINLRNANPSSPSSPTPQNPDDPKLVDGPGDPDDGVKLSVENPEFEMKSPEVPNGKPAAVSPVPPSPAALSDSGSPDVEVVDVPEDDEDVTIGDGEPEVSIISGVRRMIHDPTLEFPYNDGEPLMETVTRLVHYITNQPQPEETLFDSLQLWMDQFIRWADGSGYQPTYHSCMDNLGFWQALPEIVWAACNRGIGRTALRQPTTAFYLTFARLAAFFVLIDTQTLADAVSDVDALGAGQIPELLSSNYLAGLHTLTRRDEPRILNNREIQGAWLRPDSMSELVQRFQTMPGGSLLALTGLVEMQIELMEKFPRLADLPAAACQMVSDIVWETERRLHYPGQPQQVIGNLKQRLAQGHRFFRLVNQALSVAVDKLVNHLTAEGASGQILSLTDIYQCALRGDHEMATEALTEHQQRHPELPASLAPATIAWEWRFDMFEKLIMSSQMQLRVWAVGHMCTDLVMFWRRYSDAHDDLGPFLFYFADYLKRTELVEYILGPTCHPEIIIESGNVVGFLLVTKFYQREQTDLLWQTITTSQDRRVVDALTRTIGNIAHLYEPEHLLYLCEKLHTLPIESFGTVTVRAFCDQVLKNLATKVSGEGVLLNHIPYELCLRLLRQSSVYSAHSQVAYPEIQAFATQKLRELHHHGPDAEGRRRLYINCIEDIAERSPTTLGSLSGLLIFIRHAIPTELKVLTREHFFARLLVDELDHAVSVSQSTSGLLVLAGPSNTPRRDFIYNLIYHEPDSLTDALGRRLWDMMVGPTAISKDDRTAGWCVLNDAASQAGFDNSFVSTCLTHHFASLPSDCFCAGALRFLKEGIMSRAYANDIALDNPDHIRESGIEELWRMILTTSDLKVAEAAIDVLVKDIYIDSRVVLDYPHHRARQVHLGLVNRCLGQLNEAARAIMSSSEDTTGGDGESMVIVATEAQLDHHGRVFLRSLAVLKRFLQAHQSKTHFAAADLRPLMPSSPDAVAGDSAELKFQSFDGDKQTDVQSLKIGRQNTAASLLASLRDATGFENYRIYYKGQPFVPKETEICNSLQDLCIHNGLILVRREAGGPFPSSRMKPGASRLDIEILSHFPELWEYLSMEERYSREVYQFLVKLPADSHVLEKVDSDSASYLEVFPLSEPFKCLYAIHVLREYAGSAERQPGTLDVDGAPRPDAHKKALERTVTLILAAIGDPEVINRCPAGHLRSRLSLQLMNSLVDNLARQAPPSSSGSDWSEKAPPLRRFLDILMGAISTAEDEYSQRLVWATYTAIWLLCRVAPSFWEQVTESDAFGSATQELLLDHRKTLRDRVYNILKEACGKDIDMHVKVAEFLWPYMSAVVPRLLDHPASCVESFELIRVLLSKLSAKSSPVLDLPRFAQQCADLLLQLNSTEDIRDLDPNDHVVGGLVALLNCCINLDSSIADPANQLFKIGTARHLFWRHLFPIAEQLHGPVPKVILNHNKREELYQIVFKLVKDDDEQFRWLIEDLKKLVPFDRDDEEPYDYDLPLIFERSKGIRSPCGYAGMRNLSNTCYLNSLFTQLFMNVDFRRFILGADVRDSNDQRLLFQTQKLFSFMQESSRRFVEPGLVASSIKTYDDTLIDVHNQMDVDEFYNLLFDRWEAQLLGADERKTLRSFYGGQLVQQVKSKECEHVSERLEPFSAIQCDIKGKSTLQDSLQAYVGGEIMEGDNKYKCSTCDKHVDAVKRACLKDIPDNLIFHLKRFDFNLRTMQRSKINDYFSFPTKIDMRPYTIEHLTNPDESGLEDIFELVGVLVHSGTAESGHYYSYIRERPSYDAKERWVEFNDDLVSHWDPETLEHSTYGGPDLRYENNGIIYDKNYSAYMLFYQRSSSLQPVAEATSGPVRVSLPRDILDHIRSENLYLLRRHCLYDEAHAEFVRNVFEHCMERNNGVCSREHRSERLAMHMALGHLDQVISRTKDLPKFEEFHSMLNHTLSRCGACAMVFFRYFRDRPEAFRALVQRNPEPAVRSESGDLLITALSKIKTDLPDRYGSLDLALDDSDTEGWAFTMDSVVFQVQGIVETLWSSFQSSLRSWNEVFGTILRFARLGELETAVLLNGDLLAGLLKIIQADNSLDLDPVFQRMLLNVTRRAHNRPPNYEAIIMLADHLMGRLQHRFSAETIVDRSDSRLVLHLNGEALLPWTSAEVVTVHQDWPTTPMTSIFVCKLLEINQAPMATGNIIKRLANATPQMDDKIQHTLRANISGQMSQNHYNTPYLRAAAVYCNTSEDDENVLHTVVYVAQQCLQLNNTEGMAFVNFFTDVYRVPGAESTAERWRIFFTMTGDMAKWAPHLLAYYDRDVRMAMEELLQRAIFDYGDSPVFGEEDGGERRKEVLVGAARELGLGAVVYLRDHFLQRRVQVAKDNVMPLHRVVAKASAYFNLEPEEAGLDQEFAQLSNNVLEAMKRITVDEIEDDGSDWDNSVGSSVELDTYGDGEMQ